MGFLDRLFGRHKEKGPAPADWKVVERPDGSRLLLDPEMVDYMGSNAPQPTQASLDLLLSRARAFRLVNGGANNGRLLGTRTLLEANDTASLIQIREALKIEDGPAGHCMCHGDPTLEFFGASGETIAVIGVHHGHSIRWVGWKDDAALVNGRALLDWCAVRGVAYPLKQYERELEFEAEAQTTWERWSRATPSCLQSIFEFQRRFVGAVVAIPAPPFRAMAAGAVNSDPPVTVDVETLTRASQTLLGAVPDNLQRARVLLTWYGQGSGPWNPSPAYEEVAERLLMDVPMADLVRAVESPEAGRPLLEGTARFLAGWRFGTFRQADLALLPDELRERLVEHVQRTGEQDNLSRAEGTLRRQR